MPNDRYDIDEDDELSFFVKHPPAGTKLKERFIDRYGVFATIVFFVALAAASPIIFTRIDSHFPKFVDTGQIGDTIGGLTAPVIGVLNALLLWWTLRKQGQQLYEQSLQSRIDRQMDKLEKDLVNLSITFSFPSTNVAPVVYRGKEMCFRLINFFSLEPPPVKNDLIDPVEWKVVRYQLLNIIYLANRISVLNLQSKTSFDNKATIYWEVKGQLDLISEMLDRFFEFSEYYANHPYLSRYALTSKETRHFKRQLVLLTSRDPHVLRYGKAYAY